MMHATNLTDMKRSKVDDEEAKEASLVQADYPYGLCLSLDEASLEKLGISAMPNVGETCQLCCEAKVTAVRQSAMTGLKGEAETHKCVELQIVKLGLAGDPVTEEMEKSEARRSRFYKA